jgi:methyl-accepting chemotaxis protein
MRFFSGQSLAARLTWGFGTILVLLVAMAALSLVRMQELTSTLEEITVRNAERSRAVGLLASGVSEYVQELGT